MRLVRSEAFEVLVGARGKNWNRKIAQRRTRKTTTSTTPTQKKKQEPVRLRDAEVTRAPPNDPSFLLEMGDRRHRTKDAHTCAHNTSKLFPSSRRETHTFDYEKKKKRRKQHDLTVHSIC